MKINNRYSFLFLASLYVTTVFAEGGEDFLDAQTTTVNMQNTPPTSNKYDENRLDEDRIPLTRLLGRSTSDSAWGQHYYHDRSEDPSPFHASSPRKKSFDYNPDAMPYSPTNILMQSSITPCAGSKRKIEEKPILVRAMGSLNLEEMDQPMSTPTLKAYTCH